MFDANDFTTTSGAQPAADLGRLVDVAVEVSVELGRARVTLGEAMALGPGAVVPLDRTAGQPVDLLVNGQLVARGEVVVVDDTYGLRITEAVTETDPAQGAAELAGLSEHPQNPPLAA
ncbi:MAG: flagellar motor switch protein FliN [Solirubrobacteraceae bacterium]|nr:flagellar motor switch protein FliN [Solirubrobacteraceae bacterium]